MQVDRALRYVFLDRTWTQRLAYAFVALVAPGLVAALLHALVGSGLTLALTALTALAQFVAGVFLYYRYIRVSRTVALEGRDLPLPEPEPWLATVERAIRCVGFVLAGALTLVPVLCLLVCVFVLAAVAADSAGGVVVAILAFVAVMLTLGLAAITYLVAAQTRYLVTGDFGGSLNPAEVIRLIRGNLGDWLLAALFPVILSIGLAIVQAVVRAIVPAESDLTLSVLTSAFAAAPTIYVAMVAFHLAGQAYRLAQANAAALAAPAPPPLYPPRF